MHIHNYQFMCAAEFAEKLLTTAGPRFAGPIAILRNWTFCLFYVMAELWGSVVVSLLFWGFANQACLLSTELGSSILHPGVHRSIQG